MDDEDIFAKGKQLADAQRSARYALKLRQRQAQRSSDAERAIISGYNATLGKVLLSVKDKIIATQPMSKLNAIPGQNAMYQPQSKTSDWSIN